MKFTKFDYIQLVFNIALIAATVLNGLFLIGVLPKWVTFVGLVLAIGGCLLTNLATGNKADGRREEVTGSKLLAGLTYFTGVLWLLSYAGSLFLPVTA